MHTVNTESLGGVQSKEIIRNTKKCISRDFTMVLFKKKKRGKCSKGQNRYNFIYNAVILTTNH